MKLNGIEFSMEYIREIAMKWGIKELALFGSVLTDEFREASDIDFLVIFKDDAEIGLFELNDLRAELSSHFVRKVDIIEKNAISNPYRRAAILSSNRVLYEA